MVSANSMLMLTFWYRDWGSEEFPWAHLHEAVQAQESF